MKIKATQLRKGMIIIFEGELFTLTEVLHITPGNLRAKVQTKMKSIKSGVNAEYRFRSDETVEKASLETRAMEFLYDDGVHYYFMDKQTFDQIPINSDLVGDAHDYMLANSPVDVVFYDNQAIGLELPNSVDLKVLETDPSLKTATVTASYKPAKLETGLKVQVPQFINEGDIVRVDTRDGKYLERAK
jgi:elongation factor P